MILRVAQSACRPSENFPLKVSQFTTIANNFSLEVINQLVNSIDLIEKYNALLVLILNFSKIVLTRNSGVGHLSVLNAS